MKYKIWDKFKINKKYVNDNELYSLFEIVAIERTDYILKYTLQGKANTHWINQRGLEANLNFIYFKPIKTILPLP